MTVHAIEEERPPTPRPAKRRWDVLRRFRRDQRGVTAIEFGLIGIPFFMLMFAILETALMFWTSQVLEEALTQTSRRLLTGEALTRYATGSAADKTAAFKTDLCANAPGLVDCDKLTVDVRSYASFANARTGTDESNPVSGGNLNVSGFGYTPPQPSQIVVVRAVLEYPVLLSGWNSALVNIGTDKRALVATMTFRTEPFPIPST